MRSAKNKQSAHDQNVISWQRPSTKSSILACRLIGVALSLLRRQGEWVSELCGSLVYNLGMCGNEPRSLTWGGGGGSFGASLAHSVLSEYTLVKVVALNLCTQ